MEAKELIKSELERLLTLVDNIEVKYEFSTIFNTHIVEVLPLDIFKGSKAYIDFEIDFEERFLELFPDEEIMFVSDDSLTRVCNPEFERSNKSESPMELLREILTNPNVHSDFLYENSVTVTANPIERVNFHFDLDSYERHTEKKVPFWKVKKNKKEEHNFAEAA